MQGRTIVVRPFFVNTGLYDYHGESHLPSNAYSKDKSMAKYMIVNADDYGIASSVSQGIRESHQRGIVTSTTVMIGMEDAAKDVQQSLKETPSLGLGLHV